MAELYNWEAETALPEKSYQYNEGNYWVLKIFGHINAASCGILISTIPEAYKTDKVDLLSLGISIPVFAYSAYKSLYDANRLRESKVLVQEYS